MFQFHLRRCHIITTTMSLDAWVKIKFFDDNNNETRCVILNCVKCRARCKEIRIPKNARSVVVCFTTASDSCENCI